MTKYNINFTIKPSDSLKNESLFLIYNVNGSRIKKELFLVSFPKESENLTILKTELINNKKIIEPLFSNFMLNQSPKETFYNILKNNLNLKLKETFDINDSSVLEFNLFKETEEKKEEIWNFYWNEITIINKNNKVIIKNKKWDVLDETDFYLLKDCTSVEILLKTEKYQILKFNYLNHITKLFKIENNELNLIIENKKFWNNITDIEIILIEGKPLIYFKHKDLFYISNINGEILGWFEELNKNVIKIDSNYILNAKILEEEEDLLIIKLNIT